MCVFVIICTQKTMYTVHVSLCGHPLRVCSRVYAKACELLQAERGRVERLAQIVCEQRSLLDSCPEATKEPLQEQLARVSTHSTPHSCMHRKKQQFPFLVKVESESRAKSIQLL